MEGKNVLTNDDLLVKVGPPLSPVQRVLLTTDGTVTHVLEAFEGERICVVKLHQSHDEAEMVAAELEPSGPEMVMRRTILLQGSETRRNYVYAESVILSNRLDTRMAHALMTTDEPIGRLLIEARLETFREILVCGREPAGDRAPHFGTDPSSTLISRSYRVLAGRRPIMLITEKFPSAAWPNGRSRP